MKKELLRSGETYTDKDGTLTRRITIEAYSLEKSKQLTTASELDAYQSFLNKAAGNTTGIAALATKVALAQTENYYTSAVFVGSAYARDEVASLLAKIMLDSTINSSNADSKIAAYFEAAIDNCEYQAG